MALSMCKRGNVAERDKRGYCLCFDCKEFRKRRGKETRTPGYAAKWREANKDKLAAYQRKWIANNQEQRRQIERTWRGKNPSKVKEYNSKAGRKWSQENKDMRLASVRARQLSKIQRTPKWADREAILEVYARSRAATIETGIQHEVDHIYPLQGETVSGLHVHQNLRVLTRSENRSKGNKVCEF